MIEPVVPLGPFKHGMAWVAYRFTSTVLDDIWPGVVFFTGIAAMVACVSEFTSVNLGINSVMLTVLGTIVSLVVSFKTNNSYSRWWNGRNGWSNLTTHCRQLATLIWIHIPNAPPPIPDASKPETAQPPQTPGKSPFTPNSTTQTLSPSSLAEDSEEDVSTGYHVHGWRTPAQEAEAKKRFEDDMAARNDAQAREEMRGLIEKKTYIGLIQAFAVSMKHALRGERGPFYSDLYSLIAFLPKYNPASHPPITRDHLLALWQNGIPRQKSSRATDDIAVPLTVPIAFTPDALNQPNLPNPFDDEEKRMGEQMYGPAPDEYKEQAVRNASEYVGTDDPEVFVVTSKRDGRKSITQRRSIQVQGRTGQGGEQVTLETIELMPPRHPPPPRIWDFLPPLRIFKSIYDMFNWKKKKEISERAKGGKRKRSAMGTDMEIPQEILMYLSMYTADLTRRGLMPAPLTTAFANAILELQRAISDMEKIATTPIPSAYTFHLHLTVYAYLFFIPFQVYTYIGWVVIPATAVASIIYLGFLEIGMQIEMPFNYDQSDLDLDEFCLRIAHQIAQLTAHVILSHLNQPFLPTLRASAPDILGVPERQPIPNPRGFASSFSTYDKPAPSSPSSSSTEKKPEVKQMQKIMRDVELVLKANWKDVTSDARNVIGKPRDQLENRTGLEVAVLML
ncbi:hypothetical protein L202_05187 [Cryptococcus amylolentus CBS 6039]|uniref:Uncharacterized protein n=1 Tax=Cryptococcus amylolentus CBS 6039 TaxID=1295533 RepID=A0A1E3HJJ5_9TREE|nr:hypothetical protein L202_05187 [Cryptococcus amylolentus CBS 6039]ODN76520.1 hypothetical protein L202_05187 [Cryptococcus amylolentus CBS 6039]